MSAVSPFREDLELAGSPEVNPEPELPAFAETTTVEPEEWEPQEFDFGEAEAEAEVAHPILTLFPLPPAVLEALSGGLSSLAVGLAANAGYRDVAQLTNIVFYFRHPDMIGRKIREDERELASEWRAIRDRIVKPALQSPPRAAPALDTAPAVVGSPSTPKAKPEALSPERLAWPGHSTEELNFMRAAYVRQRQLAKGDFVMDLPPSALEQIEGRWARKDAAAAARALLAEARAALVREHPDVQIGIVSAYRPATQQFQIWQGRDPQGRDKGSGFPYYYREAIAKKKVREGDYSPTAVDAVARYVGGYIASPGYSNHQDGLAFDFGTGTVGKRLGKIGWKSWFRKWLVDNAKWHRFRPLATEAWHWTYDPPAGASEIWAGEVAAPSVRAQRIEIPRVPLLARHRGNGPDLVLRWNDMPSTPAEIDVVVHLHGFWYPRLKLERDIEPVSGLDLAPIQGESGQGRARPTLTVLPRGHDTGAKQTHGPYNAYTFPALVTKSGLTDLVGYSLERFTTAVGGSTPRVARLILTAHSGGGKALLQILRNHDPHQVHVFDALYWPPDALAAWARKRIRRDREALATGASAPDYMPAQGGALRVLYRGGTSRNSLALRKTLVPELPDGLTKWYRVERSTYDHFQIPRRYGWRLLADASADLPQAGGEPVPREAEPEAVDPQEPDEAVAEAYVPTAEPEWEPETWEGEEPEDHHDDTADYLGQTEEDQFASFQEDEYPYYPVHEQGEDEGGEEGGERELDYAAVAETPDLFEDDQPPVVDVDHEGFNGTPTLEVLSAAFDAAESAAEEPLWEVGAADEEQESEVAEVEVGETEDFLEDLYSIEPAVYEETGATVIFPSGAALRVVSGPTRPGEEHYDPNNTGKPLLDTSEAVRSTRLSPNFTVDEFAHSGRKKFDKARIDPELVRCLEKLRDRVGRKPIQVTSGYRSYLYNEGVYEKRDKKPTMSRHSSGQAADVRIAGMTGMEIAKAAIDVWGPNLGVGIADSFAHIDVRDRWARWTYYGKGTAKDRQANAEIDAYRRQRAGGSPITAPFTPPTRDGAPSTGAAVQILEALGRGLWDTAVRIAIRTGVSDANQLTNMLFYLLHPDMRGKRIAPEQRDLARQWKEIRDRWVAPALSGFAAPSSSAPAAGAGPAVTFANAAEINAYFAPRTRDGRGGFLRWFHETQANKGAWKGKDAELKEEAESRFKYFWNQMPVVFETPTITLEQFVALQSIFLNEVGGGMVPRTEKWPPAHAKEHPGMAYFFDSFKKKSGSQKASYNRPPRNRTAFDCFNDKDFVARFGALEPAKRLAWTTDTRWTGRTWPAGEEVDPLKAPFTAEADFCKFRGRGLIQTTTRANYRPLVDFILGYTGDNQKVLDYRRKWSAPAAPTKNPVEWVLTTSSNKDWDDLFGHSNFVIPCAAIRVHNRAGKNYLALAADEATRLGTGQGSFYNVARTIGGGSGKTYGPLFRERCKQILDALKPTAAAAGTAGEV